MDNVPDRSIGAADAAPLRPEALPVIAENIPIELTRTNQWVVWRYEYDAGRDQWTKIPYRSDEKGRASSTDPGTWASFNKALALYSQDMVDGIGFVLTNDCGIIGVDLDHCYDPKTKKAEQWAVEIIQQIESYSEISPSGQGVRIFARGSLPPGGRKNGSIELYETARYLTVTGHKLRSAPATIEPRQEAIGKLHAEIFKETKSKPASNGSGASNLADDELLQKAFLARNGDKLKQLFQGDVAGYPSHSEADLALCSLLAFWANDEAQLDRLFRRSQLYREKWDQRHGASTYGQRTLEIAFANRTENYRGNGHDSIRHPTIESTPSLDLSVRCQNDIEESDGLAFPEAAWVGLFRRWRDIAAPCTEASLESLWSGFLLAAGLILGRSVWRSTPRPLYPNFYLLLIGQTGDSRKSTVIWLAEELLERVGADVRIVRGIVSTEGLLETLAQKEETRALGYADEFRSLLTVARRKGTQDIIPRLQSLHSCPNQDAVTRKEKSTTAIKPFLSFITATPQAFVEDILGELEISGGFLNRFLIVTGDVQDPKPIVKPPSDGEWNSIILPLHEIRERITANPHEMEFDPEAGQLWNDFYTQWRTNRKTWNPRTADLSARTFEHVLKIAIVYSVLAGEQKISARSLAAAIAIGGWLEGNTLKLFGDTGLDRRTKAQNAVVQRLKKAKDGRMYVRDLQRGLSVKVTGSDFRDALKVLHDNDQIRVYEIPHFSGQKRKVAELPVLYPTPDRIIQQTQRKRRQVSDKKKAGELESE